MTIVAVDLHGPDGLPLVGAKVTAAAVMVDADAPHLIMRRRVIGATSTAGTCTLDLHANNAVGEAYQITIKHPLIVTTVSLVSVPDVPYITLTDLLAGVIPSIATPIGSLLFARGHLVFDRGHLILS
jgi:hypothetical protein